MCSPTPAPAPPLLPPMERPTINFSVQGGAPFQTETSVDGISTAERRPITRRFPTPFHRLNRLPEIRVEGVSNNAEFGQAGEVTTVTKSGTNQLHGSLFLVLPESRPRCHRLRYTCERCNRKARERPEKIGNDFGSALGGPLSHSSSLQRNRIRPSSSGAYEGFRFPRQTTIQDLVPTQLMQQGNFSQEVPAGSTV